MRIDPNDPEYAAYLADTRAQLAKLDADGRQLTARVDADLVAALLKGVVPAPLVPKQIKDAAKVAAVALPFALALALEPEAAAILAPILGVVQGFVDAFGKD